MAKNSKRTSDSVASTAARVLQSPSSPAIQKSLAASALSQAVSGRETGAEMETKAAKALDNPRSAATTKKLAASVVAQSNKKR